MNVPVTSVLGIDASLTSTGFALWRDGRIHLRTITTSPETGDMRTRRHRIAAEITPAVTRRTLAVKEGVPLYKGKSRGGNALELAALGGVVEEALYVRGVVVVIVQPTQVKQYATGNGNADKAQMVAAAQEQLGVLVANDDEADALWMAAMGLHQYGRPLVERVPPARALVLARNRVLAKVEWPHWSMEVD